MVIAYIPKLGRDTDTETFVTIFCIPFYNELEWARGICKKIGGACYFGCVTVVVPKLDISSFGNNSVDWCCFQIYYSPRNRLVALLETQFAGGLARFLIAVSDSIFRSTSSSLSENFANLNTEKLLCVFEALYLMVTPWPCHLHTVARYIIVSFARRSPQFFSGITCWGCRLYYHHTCTRTSRGGNLVDSRHHCAIHTSIWLKFLRHGVQYRSLAGGDIAVAIKMRREDITIHKRTSSPGQTW